MSPNMTYPVHSSGSQRKNAGGLLGNAAPSGICHTYTEDGRCVSLLKILYTKLQLRQLPRRYWQYLPEKQT